jgi:hypothetical protein
VALALAGVAVALWFFTANDDATTSGPPAQAPGVAAVVPSQFAADVRRGNVVLLVRSGDLGPVQDFATEVAGPANRALRAAGQAVIVAGDARLGGLGPDATCTDHTGAAVPCGPVADLVAYAQDRRVAVASADDPALRAFVEYWLGRSSG